MIIEKKVGKWAKVDNGYIMDSFVLKIDKDKRKKKMKRKAAEKSRKFNISMK
jgi:hypothetical protein